MYIIRPARGRLRHKSPQLAVQVYIKSGWSSMTATHKNVNEDIRVRHTHTQTHPEGLEKTVRTGLDNVPLKGRRQ